MSEVLAVSIMMNNYFHDVATAMLFASGSIFWSVLVLYEQTSGEATLRYLMRFHRISRKVLGFSLAWLLLGGIPRILFFRSFEWGNAVSKGQADGLLAKHILAFVMIMAGSWIWIKASRRMASILKKSGT